MRYKLITSYIALLFLTQVAFAQYYDTGQDPASLKWVQIKTARFKVIYPESYGQGGVEFAKSLDDAYSRLGSLFPEIKFRVPVIIHNYTTNSNGYVAWAPRRMELYPTPEQNTIPLDPQKQLSIHELAHVLQMGSLNKGFSRAMSLILGEQFYGVVAFLLPLWFLEGDAVFAESALTESGRGRNPSFQKQMKAISVENQKMYKYDQIVSGSFREFIPDHYQSGYQMAAWAMAKHDPQVWNKMLNYTAKNPFTVNPVNISLRKSIGLKKKTLYKEAFDTLQTIWTKDVKESGSVAYPQISPDKEGKYINYYSPVAVGADSIVAVKTTFSRSPSFVLINPSRNREKTIYVPGQLYPWYITYGNRNLIWVETRNDPRWANRQYSIIRKLDLRTGTIRNLSEKSRYMSAAISPDGKNIAAAENTSDNKNSLVLIDAENGNVLIKIPSPGNAYLQRPQWSEDGIKVTVITLTSEGEGIRSYCTSSHEWNTLLSDGKNDLQSAVLKNDSLFFVSSKSGTDNIYLLTPEKKISGITNSKFGAADIFINDNRILFSDYSSAGNNICITTLASTTAVPDSAAGSSSFLINRFDIKPKTIESAGNNGYTPQPYRKWQHLFKFHSWMPFYADLQEIKSDPTSIRPGITLLSQNHLSTLISSIGYEYTADKNNVFHTQVTWQGWYPVFESRLDYGLSPGISTFGEPVEDPSSPKPGLQFSNTVSVPLSFSTGRFYQYLRPSITSNYMNNYVYIKEDGNYDYGQNLISGRVYFSNYHRYAYRDIYPRWAQTFDINYSFAPFDRNIYGTEISLRTAFFFPGFLPGNGIRLRLEKEKQNPEKYMYNSRVSLPRGYENIISRDINFISTDYTAPIVYPDINIASFLYIKRIRTALFYDYAQGTGNTYYENTPEGLKPTVFHDYKETFSSSGIELMADLHLFRIPYMISAGVQSAWRRGENTPVFKFLLNIDLFGMAIGRSRM
jgi:dipeptidyl aminopeptidase/acylaminoacyl peptidase